MTPKEKAKELVDKYYITIKDKFDIWGIFYGIGQPKKCALIAVDEILDFNSSLFFSEGSLARQYWVDVKQEIEKL